MAQDIFANTNGTPLATHDANWSAPTGRNIADLTIQNNMVVSAAICAAMYAGSNGNRSYIELPAFLTGEHETGPACRMSAGDHYRAYLSTPVAGNWTEIQLQQDTRGGIASAVVSIPIAAAHNIDMIVSDPDGSTTNIIVEVDGAQVLNYNDTSGLRLTAVGLSGFWARTQVETSYVDAWSDTGSLSGGGSAIPVVTDVSVADASLIDSHVFSVTITATDDVSVAGYAITTTNSPPAALQQVGNVFSFDTNSYGDFSLYGWAFDGEGQVSAAVAPVAVRSVDSTAVSMSVFGLGFNGGINA